MLPHMNSKTACTSSLVAGILAALGATACCFGPLLLVSIGLGGAWVGSLRALEAYQPVFALLAVGCIAFAFYGLYIKPRQCEPGDVCVAPAVLRRQRIVFWVIVAIVVAMFSFPFYAHLLY